MKITAVLHLPRFSRTAPEILDYLTAIPGLTKTVFLGEPDLPGPWKQEACPGTPGELVSTLKRVCEGCETLVYIPADAPLLRRDLLDILLKDHKKYRAHYSFADGLPYGLAPEILDVAILPAMENLAQKYKDIVLGRTVLFDILAKDINAFDLETWISPRDLRPLRLSFTLDSRRNALLTERYRAMSVEKLEDFLDYLETHQVPQRTLPAYFHIQTVTETGNVPSYDGRRLIPQDFRFAPKVMELPRFQELVSKIQAWTGDGVVNPGLWGDPAFHPDFPGLVDAVCSQDRWSMVVETPLTHWKPGVWERSAQAARGKLTWIVELDAWEPEAYEKIRGEGFEKALAGAEELQRLFPGQVYVQLTRTVETESQLEGFYKGWKGRGFPVIIQKYDSLAGRLPDLKVNDISPLKRRACWHLKRDFCVLSDGRLTLCRTDWKGEYSPGNVFVEDLDGLWEKGRGTYLAHLDENYGSLCGKCDEFYTYNF